MADIFIHNRDLALELLRPRSQSIEEEDRHPWGSNQFPVFEQPLLRTWDYRSGSQPDKTNRMLSRSPRQRLDTYDARVESLTTHADHKKWMPTPFISFTSSHIALQALADSRTQKGNRGTQTITAINPNTRIAKGLPILDMMAEMHYYGVPDPYKSSGSYYMNHYLCLWEVTEHEIIGHWEWDDLAKNDRWYEEVILPAFKKHDARTFTRPASGGALDLSALWDELLAINVVSDPGFSSYEDTSSDEINASFESEVDRSDTDDEVEEANAMDDMYKTLEGD